ncbi:MAG: AAA family ATPase, partial [Pseudomonadota bacterium]
MKQKPLDATLLFTPCREEILEFDSTEELEQSEVVLGQERALESVRFGVRIRAVGYNIFALGPYGTGKLTAVRDIVTQEAACRPVPSDWCYVNNFNQPTKPVALRLPAGYGARFQEDMRRLVEDISAAIPDAFEGDEYRSRADEIDASAKERIANALADLRKEAESQQIMLLETPTGFAFAPMDKNSGALNPREFKELPEEEQQRIQVAVTNLQQRLQEILRKFPAWRKETRERVKKLNQEVVRFSVGHFIDELKERYADFAEIIDYLDAVQNDLVDNADEFFPAHEAPQLPGLAGTSGTSPFHRYQVNLFLDHREADRAPVVYENLPNHANLIGRIEYRAHMGTLLTDFTKIKPGALHRANGGYLILDVRKVLQQPYSWESLKRALQAEEIRIESLEQTLGLISTESLEPEPIPLDVKIILVGDRMLYYLLNLYDPDFSDLFKVAADFDTVMTTDSEATLNYACMLGSLARGESLRPLDRGAIARIIEHSARQAGDTEKLLTHLRSMTDLLREADYWAAVVEHTVITAADVQRALDHQIHRADRVREKIYEAIKKGTILIDTEGAAVGQINGLSVIQLGGFAFGQPSRITATTRLGHGKVVDIERETELGGAVHSKGVLILSSFISSRYASRKPFSLSASLVFEQSYGTVEGDSASLAELCALLSSLSDIPIKQSFAMTGSVSQFGQVQAIGGVNEKIEGFFDVCAASRLSGDQAVIIPVSNVRHLMLRRDV